MKLIQCWEKEDRFMEDRDGQQEEGRIREHSTG